MFPVDCAKHFEHLDSFFKKDICQKASRPLKNGVELSLIVQPGSQITLVKTKETLLLENRPALNPDITFSLGEEIPELLNHFSSNDLGQAGVFILKFMTEKEPARRINVKVHVHPLKMIRNGYFGVLALGGSPMMAALAQKGLGSFSQIKNVLSQLRS